MPLTAPDTARTFAYRVLEEFATGAGPVIDSKATKKLGNDWPDVLARETASKGGGRPPSYSKSDPYTLLVVLTEKPHFFFRAGAALTQAKGAASEMRDVRNKQVAHKKPDAPPFTMRDVRRLAENALRVLESLGVAPTGALVHLYAEIEALSATAPDTEQPLSRTMLDVLEALAGGRPLQFEGRALRDDATDALLLPPLDYFVGREDKIAEILDLLHPNTRVSYVIVDGPGGIGKSATAAQAVHRIRAERHYERVIWLTAKDVLFDHQGRHELTPDATSLHDMLVLLLQLDNKNRDLRQYEAPEDLLAAVRRLLSETATLLVVDNLETISGGAIHTFLEKQLPIPSKALVTSRIRRWAGARVQISGLSSEDVGILLNTLISQRTGKAHDDSSELAELVTEWSGGVPLAILWLLGRSGYDPARLAALVAEPPHLFGEDLLQFCFKGLAEDLSRLEHQILSLLAMFPSPLVRDRIARILGRPPSEVGGSLDHLEELSLVLGDEEYRYTVLPLSRRFIRMKTPEWQDEHQFAQRAVRAYVVDITRRYGNEPPPPEFLQAELLNLTSIMEFCETHEYWDLMIDLTKAVSEHLGSVGNSDERLRFGQAGARAAAALGDKEAQAWFMAFDVAWVLLHRDRMEEARQIWNSILHDNDVKDLRVQAMCLKNLALHHRMLAKSSGDSQSLLDEAQRLATEALQRWETIGDEHWSTTTRATLASVFLAACDLVSARREYEETYRFHKWNGHAEGQAISASKLAQVHMRAGTTADLDVAERYLAEAEAIDRRLGRKPGIAGHLERRAELARRGGDIEAARALLVAAAQLHKEIKSWTRLRRVELELAALAPGTPAD